VLVDRLANLFCTDQSGRRAVLRNCSAYPYNLPTRIDYFGKAEFVACRHGNEQKALKKKARLKSAPKKVIAVMLETKLRDKKPPPIVDAGKSEQKCEASETRVVLTRQPDDASKGLASKDDSESGSHVITTHNPPSSSDSETNSSSEEEEEDEEENKRPKATESSSEEEDEENKAEKEPKAGESSSEEEEEDEEENKKPKPTESSSEEEDEEEQEKKFGENRKATSGSGWSGSDAQSSSEEVEDEEQLGKKRKATSGSVDNVARKQPRGASNELQLCKAGAICRLLEAPVRLPGENVEAGQCNGDICSHCREPFHHACLYLFNSALCCTPCYKSEVVSHVIVEHNFGDLFGQQLTKNTPSNELPTLNDLHEFLTKELRRLGYKGKYQTEREWRDESNRQRLVLKRRVESAVGKANKDKANIAYRKHLRKVSKDRSGYLMSVKHLMRFWLESTPSVVVGLRHDRHKKCFSAKTQYKKGNSRDDIVTQSITASDDWVFDNYGNGIAAKLMDRAESQEFMPIPVTRNNTLKAAHLDHKKIVRVKHRPGTHGKLGQKGKKAKTISPAIWLAQVEDGSVIQVNEKNLVDEFGKVFVGEVRKLGNNKYVPIPVGACRRSVVDLLPRLRRNDAPPVKYTQGDRDTCVFSSFASALHSSGDKDLKKLALLISQLADRHAGGIGTLDKLRSIVETGVSWLQPRVVTKTFSWEMEIGEQDFFVGVIRDSTGSVQHAVSVHNSWIFDSNESCSLPLNKESLDCCTWDVDNGVVKETSEFVNFERGLLFKKRHKRSLKQGRK